MKFGPVLFCVLFLLSACAAPSATAETAQPQPAASEPAAISETVVPESSAPPQAPQEETVTQEGPAGTLSLRLPEGWRYTLCPPGDERLLCGSYGIQFYPDGVDEGCIELSYAELFGVCGTGLASEHLTLAQCPASVGTYDGAAWWSFVTFGGEKEHVVAVTDRVADWWEAFGPQVLEILDTVCFDPTDEICGLPPVDPE